jgi:hypothetical protein
MSRLRSFRDNLEAAMLPITLDSSFYGFVFVTRLW